MELELRMEDRRGKNPNSRKNIDQTGVKQNYLQDLVTQLNWQKRSIMGFTAQIKASTFFAAMRRPGINDLSIERRQHLAFLEASFIKLREQLKLVHDEIEHFSQLPKYTPEYEAKKKDAKKAARKRQNALETAQKVA